MNPQFQQDFLKFAPKLTSVFSFAIAGFVLAFISTPVFTYFAYKFKWWKKVKTTAVTGEKATIFHRLHAGKHKANIPTMAGVLIWGSVAIITFFFNLTPNQTYLPLFALVSIGALGLFDDIINIKGGGRGKAGISVGLKLFWLISFAILGAWWFYFKLGYDSIHIPALGNFAIGLWYIPLFILVIVATANAVNITDGLDGLAGGLLAQAFGAYAIIAFFEGNLGVAAFCATILGAVLAYTWFNIFPARFYMGDTGSLALGATLGVIAMLTNTVVVLPIICFVFVVDTLSVVIQLLSKKIFKRKVFLVAPIHHHFEAIGWPEPKVTMRFWVIGAVFAVVGTIIGLIGKG